MLICGMVCTFKVVICGDVIVEREANGTETVNVTYVHVNQIPYENITNDEWIFERGIKNKTLQGIFSRIINYNIKHHCPQYNFKPHVVPNYKAMGDYLKKASFEGLHSPGLEGEHFIFAPMPMNALIYYKLHYDPDLLTWRNGFAKSNGLVVVQRLNDVDITKRMMRAIRKGQNLFCLLALLALIVAAVMWVVDRKWTVKNGTIVVAIFNKIYWSLVTLTTVGYGDIVPRNAIGKCVGVAWMLTGLVLVSCMTSLITSDMMDNSVNIRNKKVGVVTDSWDEFVGRLLVNHERSAKQVVAYETYAALLEGVKKDDLFAGVMDENVASAMTDQIQQNNLGM